MNTKYKPQGSEKIQDVNEKANRIAQLANYGRESINESKPLKGVNGIVRHSVDASDGSTYSIIQEKHRYYIKKLVDGDYVAISGEQNLREHSNSTYSNALKQLNLMISEINKNYGNTGGINILENKKKSLN